jgi:hypothetical protein
MVTTRKPRVKVVATGRSVIYLQPVSKSGRAGKAKPFVATTVRVGRAPVVKKPRRRRTRR